MDSKQYAALVAEADAQLSKLRAQYDQWFSGVERIEPQQQRDAFERLLNAVQRECPNNTASRFRQQQLVQRYVTYTTYWRRVGRQIEEGTFRRDVAKARKQQKERESLGRAQQQRFEIDVELDVDAIMESAAALAPPFSDSTKPAATPSTQTQRPSKRPSLRPHDRELNRRSLIPSQPPRFRQPERRAATPGNSDDAASKAARANLRSPSTGKPGALSEAQLRDIYERYVAARAKNNERTDNVKITTLAKNVHTLMPKLLEKHAGKQIDFEVVVRDGKVALKPVAK